MSNPSRDFGVSWFSEITSLDATITSASHYQRNGAPPVFTVPSYMPLVRTRCNLYQNFSMPADRWEYPSFPDRGPSNGNITLPSHGLLNSTWAATSWRPAADKTGSTSTFLDVQIPQNGSFTVWGAFLTCSVDARWIWNDNVGLDFDYDFPSRYHVEGAWPDTSNGSDFPWIDHRIPEHGPVAMDADWLQTLTPSVDPSRPGFSTLASILHAMDVDGPFTAIFAIVPEIESVIATIVADGMSRVGYGINGGSETLAGFQGRVTERYGIDMDSGTDFAQDLYKGKAYLPPPPGYESNSTLLRWDIHLSGYGYQVSDVAYTLALTLFFVYSALALAHVAYRIKTKRVSSAWEDFLELLMLAQNSPPMAGMFDAGGAPTRGFLQRRVMARVRDPVSEDPLDPSGKRLALVLEDDKQRLGHSEKSIETDSV